MQESVDTFYASFLQGVADGRGTTAADVKESYGEGLVYDSPTAKSLGMIDGICTLPELLAGVMKPTERRSRASAIQIASAWDPRVDC